MAYYAPTAAPPRKESLAPPRDGLVRQASTSSRPPPPSETDVEPEEYEHELEAYQNAYGKDRNEHEDESYYADSFNFSHDMESLAETETGTDVTYHFPTQTHTPANGSNGTSTPGSHPTF